MVNENFIRKVAPLNKFVFNTIVTGERFSIEFYDGDCSDVYGRTFSATYDIFFNINYFKLYGDKHISFIDEVYGMIYNHYVNYMITDKEEVGYIWDILVSEYNLMIEYKVRECLGRIDLRLIYFPTYRSYVNRLLTVNLRNGSFSSYNTIKTYHFVPSKYPDNICHEPILIEHVIP